METATTPVVSVLFLVGQEVPMVNMTVGTALVAMVIGGRPVNMLVVVFGVESSPRDLHKSIRLQLGRSTDSPFAA